MLKKEYLVLILIFFLFIISSASAEEIEDVSSNDTDVLSADVDEIDVQYQSSGSGNEVSLSDGPNDVAISSSGADLEEDSLGDSPEITTNRTFTELENKIWFAPSGGTVYLDKDYYFNDDYYSSSTVGNVGLSIIRPVTIEGNGHIIDGLSKSHYDMRSSGIEKISFNNVTFKNFISNKVTYAPGMSFRGAAFSAYSVVNLSFSNCNFINLKCDNGYYDFIIQNSNWVSFINCSFINCSSDNDGGALFLYECNNSLFDNCRFINCSSLRWAGGVFLWNCTNATIVNCSFINNSATASAGALLFYRVSNSTLVNCSFDGNYAKGTDSDRIVDIPVDEAGGYEQRNIGSYGGAIFVERVCSFSIDSSSFDNNFASGGGGAIYATSIDYSQVKSSKFSNNSAYYGGTIYYEGSSGILNNISVSNSSSFYFGGAIASRFSDVTVNNSNFNNYQAQNGAGGAIYNYKGSIIIANSSFYGGKISRYGGAVANSQADLTILSSRFIGNMASNGGAVYSVHGDVYVNDSLFRNSFSNQGSAIYCMLSNSLTFTDNIFINNTGDKYNVYSLYSNREVVESGNHFENLYHVMVEYHGILNGNPFAVKSNVLNYVISNDGKLFNSYDGLLFEGDDSPLVTISLSDSNHPENSTIYGNYNTLFGATLYFQRNYDLPGQFKNYEFIDIYLYDDASLNSNGDRISEISDSFMISMNLSFANRTIFDYEDLIGFNGHNIAISLINSSQSDIEDIPSYYDSRDYGYVTPVRNQGDGGNCWAFAGLATLEACIKKATGLTYDFSENNPKNLMAMDSTMGANMTANGGGFDSVVMGYLTSWLGPISEMADMYDDYSSLSPILPSVFHVQNIYFLPARQNNLDNALFKRAIMDYGAVSVTLKWSNGVNHAISLIGWIDKYNDYDSLGNYAKHAWIFKNSWGTNWEDGGFGYLSFDIPFLSDDAYSPYNAYTFIFDERNENYFKSYQYEYSGVYDYLESEGSIYYSTKFVCSENNEYDEGLSAFSTFFKDPTDFTVSVFVNGELVLTQDGHCEAGYYTIPFNRMIDVKSGDEFVIMVENHNEGMNYVPVCHADETTVANVRANTSLVSFDGKHWYDLYDLAGPSEYFYQADELSNTCQIACIKAFTSLYNAQILRLDVNEFNSANVNEKITINLAVHGNQFYFDTMQVTNNTLISLNINGKYYYAKLNDGEASIDVSFDDGGVYSLAAAYGNNLFASNIVQFNFTVKANTVLSAKPLSKVYGGSENSIITLKDGKGNVISNALVTFAINGKKTTFKTNDKGQISVPINLAPNTYTAIVSYAGNNIYYGTDIKIPITVKKATPKLTASKKTFKLNKKTKKYTVTLKDKFGRSIKNAKVKLIIKGKTYAAKTNKNGKATFKINKLNRKGSFKATVKFAGNKYYRSISKKTAFKIK